jgi:hypothetical protein
MIVMGRCNCVNCGSKIISTLTDDLKIYDFVVKEIKKKEFNGCRLVQQLIILNYNNLSSQQQQTIINWYYLLYIVAEIDPYLLYLHFDSLKYQADQISLLTRCMWLDIYEATDIISRTILPYCTSQSLFRVLESISNNYILYNNTYSLVIPYFSPGIISNMSKTYIHPELAIQYLYVYV